MLKSGLLAILFLLPGCSSNPAPTTDANLDSSLDHGVVGSDVLEETSGRSEASVDASATSFGKLCQDDGECGADAPFCIGSAASAVKFCSQGCTTLYAKCPGAPAGMIAYCLLSNSKGNGCAFMCSMAGTTYTCPTGLTCAPMAGSPDGGAKYWICR